MIVEQWEVERLRRNPLNYKRHPPAQIARLRKSLARFGWRQPIVARPSDGLVIAGHGRLDVAEADGMAWVPVTPWECTDEEGRAYLVADNETQRGGEDDEEQLAKLLKQIQAADGGLDGTGFDDDEVATLLAKLEAPQLPKAKEPKDRAEIDEVPEPPVEPKSETGKVYVLGPHRLICGDSTESEVWAELLGTERAEVIWTDPPFGVSYIGKGKDALTIQNDQLDEQALERLLQQALERAFAYTAPGGAWYIKAPAGPLFLAFAKVVARLGVWRQTLVWAKSCLVLGRSDYHYRHEAIFYGWHPGAAHRWRGDRKQDTLLTFDKPSRNIEHPTMTPPDLIGYCLQQSSKPGELVVDCFGGSGSALIAADQCGRVARLIELDPKYCDVIRRRWTRYAKANGLDPGKDALED